ncbi:MAG: FHA domain-containing protein [Planctomycetota bacterium]
MAALGSISVIVAWPGRSVNISATPDRAITLGRDPECDVVVPVPTVSRQHLRIHNRGGRWMATDLGSTVGTRRQGTVLRPRESVPLMHGDQLDLGAGVLAAVEMETHASPAPDAVADDAGLVGEVASIPQASTDRLLAHVLTASRAIGQATTESDIWANAARAMAEAAGLGVSSAAVLQVNEEDGRLEALSEHGSRSHGWSRRAISNAIEKPGQTAVFERGGDAASDRATMMADSQYVACHAPVLPHAGSALVLCAEGRAALGDGRANFTHFLGIVAELAAQAVLQVRRARIARYVSPNVAAMLVRGGQDALESPPEWRHVACVFLDLQGFSTMVDREESALHDIHEQVRSTMDDLARAVFAERGMVVDFTGDGLFAAFGVPSPSEGHLGAAVRASLAARAAAPASRVGIDAGRCLFGPMGARQHAKLSLFGTVVNRASRLESLGRPERIGGGLLCTAAVACDESARSSAKFLRVGMVQPAGLTESVEVFEVVAPDAVSADTEALIERRSRKLEQARTVDALRELCSTLGGEAKIHSRLAWLEARAQLLATDSASWDGVHRLGK